MTHASARRYGAARDEADDRLFDPAGLDELGTLDLGVAADLADHDDAFGLVVLQEQVQAVHEVGAVDRIAADADAGGLAETGGRRLSHRLVSQCARAGNDADLAA